MACFPVSGAIESSRGAAQHRCSTVDADGLSDQNNPFADSLEEKILVLLYHNNEIGQIAGLKNAILRQSSCPELILWPLTITVPLVNRVLPYNTDEGFFPGQKPEMLWWVGGLRAFCQP